ncbi:DUF4129 domain-containing protein [Halosimplex marinum]|uniref:DUF4129 domain-containing protein n=1 Tax=Halosimplex marinum TaxID=3396620 RepID=UPI003F568AD5
MKQTGPRTVLVALAVLAVALGGALFPASGFGSAPADETDLIGAGGSAGVADTTPDAAGPAVTDAPGSANDDAPETANDAPETATTVPSTVVDDGPTPSPTPDATPTPSPTPVPADGGDGGGGGFGLVLWSIAGVGVALAGAAALGGLSFGSGGGSGGGSSLGPFTLPWSFGGGGGVSPAGLVKRVPQATMVALVGASTGTARLLSTTGSVASDAVSGLATVLDGSRAATGGLFAGLSGLFSVSGGSLLSVSGVLSGLGGGGSGVAGGRAPDADARAAAAVEPESGDDPIRTVEDAWAAFADPLPVADPEARTPGELARAAVDRGDPSEPVERLRDVFREVRYGGAPATDDRTRTAVEAARAVLARREDEE